jgi:hypothetical protein
MRKLDSSVFENHKLGDELPKLEVGDVLTVKATRVPIYADSARNATYREVTLKLEIIGVGGRNGCVSVKDLKNKRLGRLSTHCRVTFPKARYEI